LVARINSNTWADLVLLLPRHDFAIDPRNGNARIQTSLVQTVGNVPSKVVFWSSRAIVRTLRPTGHATYWPTQRRLLVQIKEGEFLFQTKPHFLVLVSFERLLRNGPSVAGNGIAGRSVAIAHDKNIVGTGAKGILEDAART
jgi:hypothetical protein